MHDIMRLDLNLASDSFTLGEITHQAFDTVAVSIDGTNTKEAVKLTLSEDILIELAKEVLEEYADHPQLQDIVNASTLRAVPGYSVQLMPDGLARYTQDKERLSWVNLNDEQGHTRQAIGLTAAQLGQLTQQVIERAVIEPAPEAPQPEASDALDEIARSVRHLQQECVSSCLDTGYSYEFQAAMANKAAAYAAILSVIDRVRLKGVS